MSTAPQENRLHEAGRRLRRLHAGMTVVAFLCVLLLLHTLTHVLGPASGPAAGPLAETRLATAIAAFLVTVAGLLAVRGLEASRHFAETAQRLAVPAICPRQQPLTPTILPAPGHTLPGRWGSPESHVPRAGADAPRPAPLTVDQCEYRRAREQALFLARHDALTGLANRRHFLDALDELLEGARERDEGLAVFCLNLKDFKLVNEEHGHTVADGLLAVMGRRLQLAARPAGIGARLGGDVFALALPGTRDEQAAVHAGERLGRDLSRTCLAGRHEVCPELWIGAVVVGGPGDTAEELLQHAEAALQLARTERRRELVVHSPAMQAELQERATLEKDMREAVREKRFHLEYQPTYALRGGGMQGVECLLRWNRPGHGAVPADRFIPLAEETGLIVPLGRWVLDEACRQAARWRAEGLPDFRVAVNLSAVQFSQDDLVETVAGALRRSGLPAGLLELEITERVLVADVDRALDVIRRLQALGVRMALDDFGTGYSSLAYLQRFPFDRLKIDRSFVAEIDREGPARSIVATIVQLAHTLGMDVVGEGVETVAQLRQLRRAGCDSVQGWLLARPSMPELVSGLAGGWRPALRAG